MGRSGLQLALLCASCLCAVLGAQPSLAQQVSTPPTLGQQALDPNEPARISGEISNLLLRHDVAGAVARATPVSLVSPEALRGVFNNVQKLTNGQ